MGYGYLVCPLDLSCSLEVNANRFREQLLVQWKSSINFEPVISPDCLLSWAISDDLTGIPLLGGLLVNQKVISLEGTLNQAVKFAMWYRSIIPADYELYFFLVNMREPIVPLKPSTTAEEVILAFG